MICAKKLLQRKCKLKMAVTLKQKAYEQLRQAILDGKLEEGRFLTERELVEKLKMSRTPIRAALERLEVNGLVTYTPNRGIYVTELTIDKIVDFFDFRMAIEPYVVEKLSARHLDEATVRWFEQNLARQQACVEANDFERFTAEDAWFHGKLAEVYGNKEIQQTMDRLQDNLYRYALNVLRKDNKRITPSYEDHVRIFELIRDGQGAEAAEHMFNHLDHGRKISLL